MAQAPKPGVVREEKERAERLDAAQQLVTINYDGRELSLAWRNVPILEKVEVRKATGIPYSAFIESATVSDSVVMIDEDSICVIWWLARRAAGERRLDWPTAAAEWDTSKLDEIQVSGIEDSTVVEGDNPES